MVGDTLGSYQFSGLAHIGGVLQQEGAQIVEFLKRGELGERVGVTQLAIQSVVLGFHFSAKSNAPALAQMV